MEYISFYLLRFCLFLLHGTIARFTSRSSLQERGFKFFLREALGWFREEDQQNVSIITDKERKRELLIWFNLLLFLENVRIACCTDSSSLVCVSIFLRVGSIYPTLVIWHNGRRRLLSRKKLLFILSTRIGVNPFYHSYIFIIPCSLYTIFAGCYECFI
jgi:hypothetical protein